jgi:FlaA1/EpsC-like NDP-sugar epimerase
MNILIVGGTGSLGQSLLAHYYGSKNRITVFSRDELKQASLKKKYPFVNLIIGDIRDSESVASAFDTNYPYDIVFHTAALKHVDLGEENVSQFVKTNYEGTKIVFNYCRSFNASKYVFFTTDKAVMPINAYGMSKALSEKYLFQEAIWDSLPIYIFRWGNILGSRGSAIHYFADCMIKKQTIMLTDSNCTRFWLLLEDAIKFVSSVLNDKHSDIIKQAHVPAMKASSLLVLLDALYHVLLNRGHDLLEFKDCFVETCLRDGEKFHEHMFPDYDFTSETAEQFNRFELMHLIERIL